MVVCVCVDDYAVWTNNMIMTLLWQHYLQTHKESFTQRMQMPVDQQEPYTISQTCSPMAKKYIDRLSDVRCRLIGEEWQGVAGCAIKLLILAARSRLPPINTGSNLARPRHLTLSTVYLWIWRPSHHRPHAVKGVSKISRWFWNIRRRPYLKKACLNTFLCAKAHSSYSSWLYSCLYRYR